MKKIINAFLLCSLFLLVVGCSKKATTLEITNEEKTLLIGESLELTIVTDGKAEEVVFTSSNDKIASIEGSTLKAHKKGSVTITAKLDELTATLKLQIVDEDTLLKEKYGLNIAVGESGELKIAQFADIHFGDPARPYHNGKVERTKKYMEYIIETTKPDLIVCSGDNILDTGVSGLGEFILHMESYKIPWTFIYGNHDAETGASGKTKSELSQTLLKTDTKYLLYEEDYIDRSSNRYGNFTISVLNKEKNKLLGSIVLMDAGIYDYSLAEYQYITEGQINWYKSKIDELDSLYKADGGSGVVPTIVFSHIQLPEFYDAYKKALNNDGAEFVISQNLTEAEIEEVKNGGPKHNSGLYNALKEKQSTKAFFVGHAHTNYFQVKMDGIVLGFGPQTGFSNTFKNDHLARKTYVYHLNSDFTFTTEEVNEPTIAADSSSLEMTVGDMRDVNITLSNITGEIDIEIENSEICEVSLVDEESNIMGLTSYQIKGLTSGETRVFFRGPSDLYVCVNVKVEEEKSYILYDANNNKLGEYKSLYQAIDIILTDNIGLNSYITEKTSNEKVFTLTADQYSYLTKEGTYLGFDNNSHVTGGKSSWWQTYVNDLQLYTQKVANLLNTSATSDIYGQFVSRPHNFDAFNTDGTGGFNGDPNGTWNGWQSSVYKAGITVAQYVSWADDTAYQINTLKGIYSLADSKMKPSENPNQSTRCDIWFGATYGIDPIIFGITFDSGNMEENASLADGTTREWRLFYEDIPWSGGLTTQTSGTRVYGDSIGYSTWDKENGIWVTDEEFTISVKFMFSDETNENFKVELKVKTLESEKSLVKEYGEKINRTTFRYIYGINYTPSTEGRKVADITNKGYFIGALQISVQGLQDYEVKRPNMGFMHGRGSNSARQQGIYGSDVLTVKEIGDRMCQFDFRY